MITIRIFVALVIATAVPPAVSSAEWSGHVQDAITYAVFIERIEDG